MASFWGRAHPAGLGQEELRSCSESASASVPFPRHLRAQRPQGAQSHPARQVRSPRREEEQRPGKGAEELRSTRARPVLPAAQGHCLPEAPGAPEGLAPKAEHRDGTSALRHARPRSARERHREPGARPPELRDATLLRDEQPPLVSPRPASRPMPGPRPISLSFSTLWVWSSPTFMGSIS